MKRQKGYVQLIIAVVLAAGAASAFFYIQHLRSSLELEQVNRIKAEEVAASEKKLREETIKDIARIVKAQEDLNKKMAEANKQVADLRSIFERSSSGKQRDFGNLANKKPGLIENIINAGTKDALRCNELATGAQLTPDEASGKVQNKQCPELLKDKK